MLNVEARKHDESVVRAITAIGMVDCGTGIVGQSQLETIAKEYLGKLAPTHPDGYASCILRRQHEAGERGIRAVLIAAAQVYGLQAPVLVHP
ncbi:hypothetical protein J4444_04500 [Candidatus Woesearchaeota archaeon]|nr:hypothetical protein [Candidatus Woesearchaeota archaeon]